MPNPFEALANAMPVIEEARSLFLEQGKTLARIEAKLDRLLGGPVARVEPLDRMCLCEHKAFQHDGQNGECGASPCNCQTFEAESLAQDVTGILR